ncbi:SDR family oxidoreductase [Ketobacter sp. MCCC 1A13808]|uniref:SDR family NAD(P)-dependent oxidoreductase n=1 Tax=Ketobacter sp. MCCC 1A13808 TaxID=2602738 RepID=UPI0013219C71|nr:SDR family oxidoreductase [Ketobacter sp. MCCC 1A13808]MVF13495.1 SDR family oxidoreductase [Ketobacter sp. MCCC 1A13808]
MGQDLAGKVAIVTGGAGGIGRATVELFVREGAKVVIADINDEQGESLASELGESAYYRRVDVSKADQMQALVDFTVEHFGGLHIMFNNAGISGAQHARFLDDDLSDFNKVVGINLFGVMAGSSSAGKYMSKNGGGVIINNASIAGLLPGQALMTYRATKAAMIMFSKSLAIDLAEYGIRVNCLAPGHIRTSLTAFSMPGMTEEQIERVKQAISPAFDSNQPLKRHGKPDDVAQTVLFLASDRAAQITGVVLPVDGGITAGDPVNHLREIQEARAQALADIQGGTL